ncbi:unnamed protein product [Symbiodinium sp. CCMP2592]|nr:unnamed protein product [Symbiodinium sp. CCMP2592]CAE7250501.1 unnamed protein product [Symbiodinium sp. CCMP2592]
MVSTATRSKVEHVMKKLFAVADIEDANTCLHPMDWLASLPDMASMLEEQQLRVQNVLAGSGGWRPPAHQDVYPPGIAPGEVLDLLLPTWFLGFGEASALRGKPKAINILETVRNFLDGVFQSAKYPLSVYFPSTCVVGDPIEKFTVSHAVGMTRSVATKCVLALIEQAGLSDAEFVEFVPLIKSCLYIKCTFESYSSDEDLLQRSILSKMVVAESTRPDIIQLFHSFSLSVAKQGLVYSAVIDSKIADFNRRSSVDSGRISDAERQMLKLLPLQDKRYLSVLSQHWDAFKATESAIPLRTLVKWTDRALPADMSIGSEWKLILTCSALKNLTFLMRQIAIFLRSLKEAMNTAKKSINLAFRAPKLRDPNPQIGYDMCCLWCHFATDFEKMLGPTVFAKAETQFLRGQFDREMTEKCRTCDAKIVAKDFRFISVLMGTNTNVQSLQVVAAAAESELEQARLKAVTARLAQEEHLWREYLDAMKQWTTKNSADRTTFLLREKDDLEKATKELVDGSTPVYFLDNPGFLSTTVQSAVHKFSVAPDLFQVMVCDLTKLGSAFSKYIVQIGTAVSEFVNGNPKFTCGLVFAPNCAEWGSAYSEKKLNEAVATAETQLRTDELHMSVRRGTLTFAESSIPNHSRRRGFHEFFMVVSDVEESGQLVSGFSSSALWVRTTVADVPLLSTSEYIVPDPSMLHSGSGLSKSQRLKQSMSGQQLWHKLLPRLWHGMPTSALAKPAVYVDILPYDLSLTKALLHFNTQPKSVLPQGKLASIVWAKDDSGTDHRRGMQQWLISGTMNYMQKMVDDKILTLPGYTPKIYTAMKSPQYNEEDFVMTMPLVECEGQKAALPFRQAWLDSPDGRFNACKIQFDAVVAAHDKEFNVSGVPFKGQKRMAPLADESDPMEALLGLAPAAETKAQLEKPLVEISAADMDLLIDAKKQLWLLAKKSTIISCKKPLLLLWGEYIKDDVLKKRQEANNAWLMEYKFDSPDMKAFHFHELGNVPAFEEGLTTIKSFLKFLEQHAIVQPSMACHEITVAEDSYKINMTKECCFEKKPLPANQTPSANNGGSLLSFSGTDLGQHLKLVHRLKYNLTDSSKGIFPQKPGIFLTHDMKVEAGKLYRLPLS